MPGENPDQERVTSERLHAGTPASEWNLQLNCCEVTVRDVDDALLLTFSLFISFFKHLFYYF